MDEPGEESLPDAALADEQERPGQRRQALRQRDRLEHRGRTSDDGLSADPSVDHESTPKRRPDTPTAGNVTSLRELRSAA